jgi:RHS repeat-associated protein
VQKWNPNYSTAPVIGSAITVSVLTANKTTDYIGNMIYENGTLKRILIDGGYIEGGAYYYYLTDHLGNNRLVANASGIPVQKTHYYPFGMAFAESQPPNETQVKQPYKYNGKELDQMHGLNQYDYAARYYDPAIARFTTIDPKAEKYYSISPYAYCANNPVRYTDPDGQEISFTYKWEKDKNGNYVINKDGGRNLVNVTMNVTGKVINISSNSKVDVSKAAERISSQIESSFKGIENGVTFSSNVDLAAVTSMNDVAESDHVFALTDFDNSRLSGNLQGHVSDYGGKVAFIDADLFTGALDERSNIGPGNAAHEFGHLANLGHAPKTLMQENPGGIFSMWSTKITNLQLTIINQSFQNRQLNQGKNWEYKPGTLIKMPYRGYAKPYVKY